MTEFDKEIVRVAETMAGAALGFGEHPLFAALVRAVAAKREAERPKLMTAEEAQDVFLSAVNCCANAYRWDHASPVFTHNP